MLKNQFLKLIANLNFYFLFIYTLFFNIKNDCILYEAVAIKENKKHDISAKYSLLYVSSNFSEKYMKYWCFIYSYIWNYKKIKVKDAF